MTMLFKSAELEEVNRRWQQTIQSRCAAGNMWDDIWSLSAQRLEESYFFALRENDPQSWRAVCERAADMRSVLESGNGQDTLYYLNTTRFSDEIDKSLREQLAKGRALISEDKLQRIKNTLDAVDLLIDNVAGADGNTYAAFRRGLTQAKKVEKLLEKEILSGPFDAGFTSLLNIRIAQMLGAIRSVVTDALMQKGRDNRSHSIRNLTIHTGAFLRDTKARFLSFRLPWLVSKHEAYFETERISLSELAILPSAGAFGHGSHLISPGSGRFEWFQDFPEAPEMLVVPAGAFVMGAPSFEEGSGEDERPQHTVTISYAFAVSRFAITFDEWDTFARATNGYFPADNGWGRGRRPVINVSASDAEQYINWLSVKTRKQYRLLTEAEWEYVARAGTDTVFWWGNSITTEQANYDGAYVYGDGQKGEIRAKTLEVAMFDPNPWGLYQVHGNVWEWVQDQWNESYMGAPEDGSAWLLANTVNSMVLRGGSWIYAPKYLRAAFRLRIRPGVRNDDVGFRVAREFP